MYGRVHSLQLDLSSSESARVLKYCAIPRITTSFIRGTVEIKDDETVSEDFHFWK